MPRVSKGPGQGPRSPVLPPRPGPEPGPLAQEPHRSWGQASSHRAPAGSDTESRGADAGTGADPTTHGARRPGHRSRGRSGRRPTRAHRCRGCGRSIPGGRRHRSAQRGRLGRGPAGQPPATGEQGARGWPLGTSLIRGSPAALPGPTATCGPRKRPRAMAPLGSLGPPTLPPPHRVRPRSPAGITLRLCWNLPKIHCGRHGKHNSFLFISAQHLCQPRTRCWDVTVNKTWSWISGAPSLAGKTDINCLLLYIVLSVIIESVYKLVL